MKVSLRNSRLAFSDALWEAKQVNGEGKPAFSCCLLIPPDHPQVKEIHEAMIAVAKEKWGAKAEALLKEMATKDRLALHDGNGKSQYDGFPGNLFISARSQARPTIKDRDGKTPLTAQDGKPYAGCFVNAILEFWAQDNKFGKRINAQVRGVQFLRDGDAFSAATAASDEEFEDMSDGADAGEMPAADSEAGGDSANILGF